MLKYSEKRVAHCAGFYYRTDETQKNAALFLVFQTPLQILSVSVSTHTHTHTHNDSDDRVLVILNEVHSTEYVHWLCPHGILDEPINSPSSTRKPEKHWACLHSGIMDRPIKKRRQNSGWRWDSEAKDWNVGRKLCIKSSWWCWTKKGLKRNDLNGWRRKRLVALTERDRCKWTTLKSRVYWSREWIFAVI